jgi:amidase
MYNDRVYSIEDSHAFIEVFTLEPKAAGPLSGLTFAVKDLMDVAGHRTGCGNPTWRDTHPPASTHAVCVEQLLLAGAQCIGKTITDELAYSLLGENYFYGTPLNPKWSDRVPGGSSSGSVSAVACGHADFALGTDTGGSVRVPASNCGIFGIRPSHDIISVAGVNPLSPTFDTVGVFASNAHTLSAAASVLLSLTVQKEQRPDNIFLIQEGFSISDSDVREALKPSVQKLRDMFGSSVREVSIREIDLESRYTDLFNWYEIYRVLQRAEVESCLGAWVTATKAEFGPGTAEGFELTRNLDRSLIPSMHERRERYFESMNRFLGDRDLLCFPTSPGFAPLKGSLLKREASANGYYPRAVSMTSVAGVARIPQISIPVVEAPVGLSLCARNRQDGFLLSVVELIAETLDFNS